MTINTAYFRNRTMKWYMFLLLLGMVVLLFCALLAQNAREMEQLKAEEKGLRTRLTESLNAEQTLRLQVSSASSGSNVASEARAMSFVTADEVCFEVMDAELLDRYTEREWQILMEERRLDRY